MENVRFVKNVKNGKELFSNIKCVSEDTLIRRIERETLCSFRHKNNDGNYVFSRYIDGYAESFVEFCIRFK